MEAIKEVKKVVKKPTVYNDAELRVRVEDLEKEVNRLDAKLKRVWTRLGLI